MYLLSFYFSSNIINSVPFTLMLGKVPVSNLYLIELLDIFVFLWYSV